MDARRSQGGLSKLKQGTQQVGAEEAQKPRKGWKEAHKRLKQARPQKRLRGPEKVARTGKRPTKRLKVVRDPRKGPKEVPAPKT